MREFAFSAGAVGAGLGASTTAGSILGLVMTAASAKYLTSKWGAVTPVRLPQFGFLIVGILAPFYLVARSPTEMFLIAGAQTAAATGSSSLLPTVVQNLAPAHLRGRVFAISTVIGTLFQVVSPLAVGLLSDHVFKETGGLLLSSIVVGAPCLLLAAATLRLAEKHILKTVDAVQMSWGMSV
jgi:MFS family permease